MDAGRTHADGRLRVDGGDVAVPGDAAGVRGERRGQCGQQITDQFAVPGIRHQLDAGRPDGRRCGHRHVGALPRLSVWTHHGAVPRAELWRLLRAHGHVGAGLQLLWTRGDVHVLQSAGTQEGVEVVFDGDLGAPDSEPVWFQSTLWAHGDVADLVPDRFVQVFHDRKWFGSDRSLGFGRRLGARVHLPAGRRGPGDGGLQGTDGVVSEGQHRRRGGLHHGDGGGGQAERGRGQPLTHDRTVSLCGRNALMAGGLRQGLVRGALLHDGAGGGAGRPLYDVKDSDQYW